MAREYGLSGLSSKQRRPSLALNSKPWSAVGGDSSYSVRLAAGL